MPTLYEILGVHHASEQEVIEAAYKALIRKYHPDKAGENERIREINRAYDVLGSPIKRKAYDISLKLFSSTALTVQKSQSSQYSKRSSEPGGRRGDQSEPSATSPEPRKRCPDCGERVVGMAQVCRYCGYRFHKVVVAKRKNPILGCLWVVAGVLCLILLFAIISDVPSSEQPTASELQGAECGPDGVTMDLGDVEPRGTLELLARKAETDGYERLLVTLDSGTCISRKDIEDLAAVTKANGVIKLLVGHDPEGTADDFRARFTYETDGTTPLSEMPRPPNDMHFGEATWSAGGSAKLLKIGWYANFRDWQRKEYFTGSMYGSKTTPPDGMANAFAIPQVFRGRWTANLDGLCDGTGRTINETEAVSRAGGDITQFVLTSPTTALVSFTMNDQNGPFAYQEQWSVNASRGVLTVTQLPEGGSSEMTRCLN